MYFKNPDDKRAQADKKILELVGRKTKFKGPEAHEIVETFYRALGYIDDSRSQLHALLSPSGKFKVVFKARNIAVFQGGRGNWHKRSSASKIATAENIVAKARGEGAQKTLDDKRKKVDDKKTEKARRENIEMLARKAALIEITNTFSPQERVSSFTDGEFKGSLLNLVAQYKLKFTDIKDLKALEQQLLQDISVDTPPLFVQHYIQDEDISLWPTSYKWKQDGIDFLIQGSNTNRGIEIHVGGTLVGIDPFRCRADEFNYRLDSGQPGYISGGLYFGDILIPTPSGTCRMPFPANSIIPGLFMIVSNTKRRGVGTKLLKLFCRLVKSYGFEKFLMLGVGEEGARFFDELERRGEISIETRRGVAWTAVCLRRNPRELTGKFLSEVAPNRTHRTIYRGVVATTDTFKPNDYITLSRKWAEDHADHLVVTGQEDVHVIKATVSSQNIREASNPGEYFYVGPEIIGRSIYRTNYDRLLHGE